MKCELKIVVGGETRTEEADLPVTRDARPGKLIEAGQGYVKRVHGKAGILLSVKDSGTGFRITGPSSE